MGPALIPGPMAGLSIENKEAAMSFPDAKARRALQRAGIPPQDAYDLPSSTTTFPDGAHYRMEISGVERPNVLEALVDEMHKRDIPIHRLISVVMGATLLDDAELKHFARVAAEARCEVIMTPGPRSAWDTGRQLVTPEGGLSGLRFRGSDQLRAVVTDIVELGFRGFLAIDEGLLWLLTEMKKNGDLPQDVVIKVSIYAGHGSAAGGKVLQALGANTFNPVGDLSLPQLASIRQAIDIPMDLHIYLADSFGGYNRFYEAPEMARVCAPCYFKMEPGPACAAGPGALYKPYVSPQMLADWAREKVKFCQILHEIIQDTNPSLKLSAHGVADLAIPQP
jgi:hypothetical protein